MGHNPDAFIVSKTVEMDSQRVEDALLRLNESVSFLRNSHNHCGGNGHEVESERSFLFGNVSVQPGAVSAAARSWPLPPKAGLCKVVETELLAQLENPNRASNAAMPQIWFRMVSFVRIVMLPHADFCTFACATPWAHEVSLDPWSSWA